jgi:hypothetical protein
LNRDSRDNLHEKKDSHYGVQYSTSAFQRKDGEKEKEDQLKLVERKKYFFLWKVQDTNVTSSIVEENKKNPPEKFTAVELLLCKEFLYDLVHDKTDEELSKKYASEIEVIQRARVLVDIPYYWECVERENANKYLHFGES